jgi:hypothetical protein
MSTHLTAAWRSSLVMGLCCVPVGAAMGIYLLLTALGGGYGAFAIAAPVAVAAGLAGTLYWWVGVARGGHTGRWRGALAAVLGHWLGWYLLFLHAYLRHALTGSAPPVSGPIVNPLLALVGSGLYALLSLYFFGWITVPAGALMGGFLVQAQARRRGTPIDTPP